jgi:hypothetical protein
MLCTASPTFAHAFLERASPPVGSELPVLIGAGWVVLQVSLR